MQPASCCWTRLGASEVLGYEAAPRVTMMAQGAICNAWRLCCRVRERCGTYGDVDDPSANGHLVGGTVAVPIYVRLRETYQR